jgi:hypothetical protein
LSFAGNDRDVDCNWARERRHQMQFLFQRLAAMLFHNLQTVLGERRQLCQMPCAGRWVPRLHRKTFQLLEKTAIARSMRKLRAAARSLHEARAARLIVTARIQARQVNRSLTCTTPIYLCITRAANIGA